MFMMNNGPFFPKVLKKKLFTHFPDDLRPSRFATLMAHFGTVVEYSIPILLILGAMRPLRSPGCCETMVRVLARLYDDQPQFAYLATPPLPEERLRATFCGT